jgi:hypothetical protein
MNNEFDELELEQRSMASVYAAERHTKRSTKRGISGEREFAWPRKGKFRARDKL